MKSGKKLLALLILALMLLFTNCGEKESDNISKTMGGRELAPDPNTIALYHFNSDFKDSSGNGRDLKVENPLNYVHFWDSCSPVLGQALCLSQTHQVESGQKTVIYSPDLRYPGDGSWTVEALIYVGFNATRAKIAEHYSEGIAA